LSDEFRKSYDRVAEDYAAHFEDELDKKPFDRKMLDWLAEKTGGRGIVCDMGCGPGQIARYLAERGVEACGIDLAPEMVKKARELNPGISFESGDMLALDHVPDAAFAGIAAFYSIIHIARGKLNRALSELQRVLKPDGVLLIAFHLGSEIVHMEEWWGKKVALDFFFYEREEMKTALAAAGFELEETIERDPYADVEYPSRRAYIFARKTI
jgi:SAM-dependent methyltransferase